MSMFRRQAVALAASFQQLRQVVPRKALAPGQRSFSGTPVGQHHRTSTERAVPPAGHPARAPAESGAPRRGRAQASVLRRAETLVADGWTPHVGIVDRVGPAGATVDLGCDRMGLLPAHGFYAIPREELATLRPGGSVTVYVSQSHRAASGEVKMTLALSQRHEPRDRLKAISPDGHTPYEGIVVSLVDFGAFVDIGCEVPGLLAACRESVERMSRLYVGDRVTVYAWSKMPQTRKLHLSLERRSVPLLSMEELVADACTPYEGRVDRVTRGIGAFIDIGAEVLALVPENDLPLDDDTAECTLSVSEAVTVYITCKSLDVSKITASFKRRARPLRPLEEVAVDGQTPYRGEVLNVCDFGAFVDYGFYSHGLIPTYDIMKAGVALQAGSQVTVYAVHKAPDTGRLTLSLQRRAAPLERFSALVSDGCMPYAGRIRHVDGMNIYVDIGSEYSGMLALDGKDGRTASLRAGDEITVYVASKAPQKGRIRLAMEPRSVPLQPLSTLRADGQTAYEGIVESVFDVGVLVDIGFECLALVPRIDMQGQLQDLSKIARGSQLTVYVLHRNLVTGKIRCCLASTPAARKAMGDVLSEMAAGRSQHEALVYGIKFNEVYIDLGCEVAGILPRAEVPHVQPRDRQRVRVVRYDADRDKFLCEGV